MRAVKPSLQTTGRAASRPGGTGQGSRRSGCRRTSSRASIRPDSNGASATCIRRLRTAKEPPPPCATSPIETCPAVSTGRGRSERLIGPAMRTGRPSREEASASAEPRKRLQSSSGGNVQAHAAATMISAAADASRTPTARMPSPHPRGGGKPGSALWTGSCLARHFEILRRVLADCDQCCRVREPNEKVLLPALNRRGGTGRCSAAAETVPAVIVRRTQRAPIAPLDGGAQRLQGDRRSAEAAMLWRRWRDRVRR